MRKYLAIAIAVAAALLYAAPAAADAPARLLFWSGFESAQLGAPFGCYRKGCWQELTGRDAATGFSWPPQVYGSETRSRFQLLVDGPLVSPETVGHYMYNELQWVAGPKGRRTRALYMHIARSGCCDTAAQDGRGVTQNPYLLFPTRDVPELYVSYWVKLQPDLAEKMRHGTWRGLFEWKTSDTDRRATVGLQSHGGTPYWVTQLDQRLAGEKRVRLWRISNKAVPVPAGEWLKLEVYWKRGAGNDGRIWAAVNGRVIADQYGSNIGPNLSPINRIFVSTVYTGSPTPAYQWLDDLQIWSAFPTAAPTDPWYDPPYATR